MRTISFLLPKLFCNYSPVIPAKHAPAIFRQGAGIQRPLRGAGVLCALLDPCFRGGDRRGRAVTLFFTFLLFVLSPLLCAAELRDPTLPHALDSPIRMRGLGEGQEYGLTSLWVSPYRKIAVINQKTVREGDVIGHQKVLAISLEGVLLQGEGEKPRLLKMFVPPVKRPSTIKK